MNGEKHENKYGLGYFYKWCVCFDSFFISLLITLRAPAWDVEYEDVLYERVC